MWRHSKKQTQHHNSLNMKYKDKVGINTNEFKEKDKMVYNVCFPQTEAGVYSVDL